MNNPIPLEYLTSFSQTSQAMMQQLATGLLTSGDNATNFTRYSELAPTRRHAGAGTQRLGSTAFAEIETAPGRYVTVRAA
jgi:hypothetical protein